jgi:hypothetical protein
MLAGTLRKFAQAIRHSINLNLTQPSNSHKDNYVILVLSYVLV